MTKISVITAVYNRRKTIGQALDSLFAQTHPAFESIVIDGGSTDGTREILEHYRPRLGAMISEPDEGIYDALNKGIRSASGDVVGFLHADDMFQSTDALAAIAKPFEDPRVDAVYGDLVYVSDDDTERVVRRWQAGRFDTQALPRGWMPPHPTFYARREVYERLGVFDTRYRIAADYDSILRFLGHGGINVRYVPQVLVRMRVGGISNRSIGTILRKSREDYAIVRRHRIGGLMTILRKNFGKLGQFTIAG